MMLRILQSELYKTLRRRIWMLAARAYGIYLKKIGLILLPDGCDSIVFVDPFISWVLEPHSHIVVKSGIKKQTQHEHYKGYPNGIFIGGTPDWQYLNPPVSKKTTIRLKRGAALVCENNVLVCCGTYISVWPDQSLELKSGVYVGHESYINTRMGLVVDDNSMIGHRVTIMDYDGHPIIPVDSSNLYMPDGKSYGGKSERIRIEKKTWVGFETAVLKGAVISEGAIVGAKSVITGLCPKNSISAGNPAKILKEGVTWKQF
jgi:acetyltransferase-like isoleucine patch superfamily enzyme